MTNDREKEYQKLAGIDRSAYNLICIAYLVSMWFQCPSQTIMYISGAMDVLSVDLVARDQNSNFPVDIAMDISFEV
jgi:hypothetical protein